MKIIVKVPKTETSKWSLQSKLFPARRFKTASGVLNRLQSVLLRTEFDKKLAIVIKMSIDSSWENVNESLDSKDRDYLNYAAGCFLEDYLSPEYLKSIEKRYLKAIPDDL